MVWLSTRVRASGLIVALAALFLGACDSGTERRAVPPPTVPRAVAAQLAHASDGVAAALAAGDNCRALTLARALREQTRSAQIPRSLQRPLRTATNDLVGRIVCAPPAPPTVTAEPGEGGKEHGKGKGKHKGEKKHGKEHD